MKAVALMLETFRRKGTVMGAHIAVLALYLFLCLFFLDENSGPVGAYVLIISGVALPLMITNGIFGNDIASGRIRGLITKPVRLGEFYLWRVSGVTLQGAIHIGAASVIFYGCAALGGKVDVERYWLWVGGAILLLICWSALSTTVSLLVNGEHNSILLLFGIILAAVIFLYTKASPNSHFVPLAQKTLQVIHHVFPPVVLLFRLGTDGANATAFLLRLGHVALLTTVYAAVGIAALCLRQYTPQRQ